MTQPNAESALEDEALNLLAHLGWNTANAFYEAFAPEQATARRPYLGRAE